MANAPRDRVRRWTAAVLAFASVAVEFRDPADHYFAYFTILTNLMIGLWFTAAALAPGRAERWRRVRLGVTVYGLATLTVYWVLLAPDHHPGGLSFFANLGLHLVVPLAMAAEGLIAPWGPMSPRAVWGILVWPLVYGAGTLIRGQITGWYPYFFLDPQDLGGTGAQAAFVVGLLTLFLVLGWGWWAVIRRRQGVEAKQAAP